MITSSFGLTATERVLPKLALDFTTASLDSRVTFTRTTGASNPATYVNSSGVVTAATNNQPRFDYDPVTLACKGLLIEESRQNVLTYSEDLRNTADAGSTRPWIYNNSSVTVNSAVAPDGQTTADLLTENTANSQHSIYQSLALPVGSHSFTFFAKSNGKQWITSYLGQANTAVYFDIVNGVVGTTQSQITAATIQNYGNGWFKCSSTGTISSSSAITRGIYLANSNGNNTYVGDGVSGAYLWGAQLEAGAFATSYIPTTTTALTRNADVATMTGTNFSDWYNATEGAIFTECSLIASSVTNKFAWSIFSDSNNRMHGFMNNGAYAIPRFLGVVAGSNEWNIIPSEPVIAANTPIGLCCSYKANSVAAYIEGTLLGTDTSATIPSVNRLSIGSNETYLSQLNGHILKFFYYPQRLTNAETQAFSKV